MTFNQLQYLIAFSEEKTISKTAEKLRVSTPQVRATLNYLNEACNRTLFTEYDNAGSNHMMLKLTPTGEATVVLAKGALGFKDAIVAITQNNNNAISGRSY